MPSFPPKTQAAAASALTIAVLTGLVLILTPAASVLTIERAAVDVESARSRLEAHQDAAAPATPGGEDDALLTAATIPDPEHQAVWTLPATVSGTNGRQWRTTAPWPPTALAAPATGHPEGGPASVATEARLKEDLVVVIAGSDARPGVDGKRADVIVIAHAASDPETPITLISIPRDLVVSVPCRGDDRVNTALMGCDHLDINGLELLALALEEWADVTVDHVVAVGFVQFQDVIDEVGGHLVCLDHPLRDTQAHLDLPAGCQNLGGADTLGWVRSRSPEVRVDGRWEHRPTSDLTRTDRQRDLLMGVFDRVREAKGVTEVSRLVAVVADTVTIDSQWSTTAMISDALALRQREAREGVIETSPYTDQAGRDLLEARETYHEARTRLLDGDG